MKSSDLSPIEYNLFYKRYIDLVDNIDLLDSLKYGMTSTQSFYENIPEDKWNFQYAPDKWTPKDILLHISDTERVFAYRALYFARSKNVELKGFDENIFAENAFANNKTVDELLQNYIAVRHATLSLFTNFDANQLIQTGQANGSNMSTRAAGFIICGHEKHHCNIITERYL